MSEALGMVAAGAGSSIAGTELGNVMSGGSNSGGDIQALIGQMNGILQNASNKSQDTLKNYTNQAVNQQNTSLGTASNALNTGLANTTGAVNNALQTGINTSQAVQSPYAQAGYNALDAYNQSLGLQTPQGGSANLVGNALQGLQQQNAINQFLKSNPNTPTNPGSYNGPSAPNSNLSSYITTPDQVQQYIKNNLSTYAPIAFRDLGGYQGITNGTMNIGQITGDQNNIQNATQALEQQQYQPLLQAYNQAQQQYNTNLNNYNNYNTALQNLPSFNPQAINAARNIFGGGVNY